MNREMMPNRRDLLRSAALAPFGANLVLRGEPVCPSPCGPTGNFMLGRPTPAGTRVALERLTDWSVLKSAYAAIQPGSGMAALADQQRIHAFYAGATPAFLSDIHEDPSIFLWHRWFLYFHERLLSWALGGNTQFALPYWDGSLDERLPLPDQMGQTPLMPPGSPCHKGQAGLATQANSVVGELQRANDIAQAYNAIKQWHSDVHILVPLVRNRPCLMQEMETAAGDPLFYAFHAQFDRLFDWWYKLGGKKIDSQFLGQQFGFVDFPPRGQPQCVCVTAGDALHLVYEYDVPTPNPRPGWIRPPDGRGGQSVNTVEIDSVNLEPGVHQYQVWLACGKGRVELGLYNLCAHHMRQSPRPGRAVYKIPEGFDCTNKKSQLELVPVGSHSRPVRLSSPKQFSLQTMELL